MTITWVLVLGAIVLLLCVFLHRVSAKLGVPSLLLFMLLGMLFGSDGILKIPFDDYAFAENICSIALIFIMFSGGFETSWKSARPVAAPGILLSVGGVALTAGLTGLFCHFALRMPLLEGLLLGAVIGSTDAASVFSILRSKSLNLKNGLASMLELESGSNDPTAYALTAIFLSLLSGKGGNPVWMFLAQVVFGVLFGVGVAVAALFILHRFTFEGSSTRTIFVLACAVAAYALPLLVGGNGYLSVYIAGILLGNSKIADKPLLVQFFGDISGMMQIVIFFLLGLLAFPSRLPAAVGPAALLSLFMIFVARPISVCAILAPFRRYSLKEQLLVAWAGLRGAAAVVFAIFAVNGGVALQFDLYHLIFCMALISVAAQGSLLPWMAKKLDLVDENNDVLRTFTDYTDESDMALIEMRILPGHNWANKTLKEVNMITGSLAVMLIRAQKTIIPCGATRILEGDTLVINCPAYRGDQNALLEERPVYEGHKWEGKSLSEIDFPDNTLVVMIKRGSASVIPRGNTKIMADDVLVLHRLKL